MLAKRSKVMRDGRPMEIDSKELVPGDVVVLKGGDATPADLRMFYAAGRLLGCCCSLLELCVVCVVIITHHSFAGCVPCRDVTCRFEGGSEFADR
jgi:hypothetical protein